MRAVKFLTGGHKVIRVNSADISPKPCYNYFFLVLFILLGEALSGLSGRLCAVPLLIINKEYSGSQILFVHTRIVSRNELK